MPAGTATTVTNTMTLPRKPEAVSAARRALSDLLPEDSALQDTAPLLISEVVTNAVRYASGTRVKIAMATTDAGGMFTAVFDPDPSLRRGSRAKDSDDSMESGRGLNLLDMLADSWGVTTVGDEGKWVWFELAQPAGETRPAA
ncbi:ATP-binding protein [Streptomyces klenkii]|uniref:ATP-binding protein n=1 Tax=Streptomyces klenkii TaxID=1420899 RepID=UPI0034416807